ncbi:MAG: radical SAM protein [Bacteroidetes bacterium]|nr:radical SAM protein [Bacteroidota bacterium]
MLYFANTLNQYSVPTKEIIDAFNKSRKLKQPTTLCYAPELSLNFDQSGRVTACCFNRQHILGTYPEDAVKDIWQGKKNKQLRQSLRNNSLVLGCQLCNRMLNEGNYNSVLISHFDDFVPQKKSWNFLQSSEELPDIPLVFEFEISNTCNLECIMCGGNWSSAIRKNREGLAAIVSPYDDNFVEEIREFLPGLHRANFLGGEPFLISLYYPIWDSIIEVNPGMEVAITSNGTTLTKRAKNIIDKLTNLKITLSIDSLSKTTYESIRTNAVFEQVKSNIDYLIERGKLASFSVCPMVQNRYEVPGIIEYCEEQGIDIFFNVVYEPLGSRIEGIHELADTDRQSGTELLPETSMKFLPEDELNSLIHYYEGFTFMGKYQERLNGLIAQLRSWLDETNKQ